MIVALSRFTIAPKGLKLVPGSAIVTLLDVFAQ